MDGNSFTPLALAPIVVFSRLHSMHPAIVSTSWPTTAHLTASAT